MTMASRSPLLSAFPPMVVGTMWDRLVHVETFESTFRFLLEHLQVVPPYRTTVLLHRRIHSCSSWIAVDQSMQSLQRSRCVRIHYHLPCVCIQRYCMAIKTDMGVVRAQQICSVSATETGRDGKRCFLQLKEKMSKFGQSNIIRRFPIPQKKRSELLRLFCSVLRKLRGSQMPARSRHDAEFALSLRHSHMHTRLHIQVN